MNNKIVIEDEFGKVLELNEVATLDINNNEEVIRVVILEDENNDHYLFEIIGDELIPIHDEALIQLIEENFGEIDEESQ